MWKHHEIIYTWTPSKLNKIRYFRKFLDKSAIWKIPYFQTSRALKFMYQISDQLVLCNHVIRYLIKYLWFNALDKISETLKMNKCFLLILKICWKSCSWKDCQSVKGGIEMYMYWYTLPSLILQGNTLFFLNPKMGNDFIFC